MQRPSPSPNGSKCPLGHCGAVTAVMAHQAKPAVLLLDRGLPFLDFPSNYSRLFYTGFLYVPPKALADWPGCSKNHTSRTKRNQGILEGRALAACGGDLHVLLLYGLLSGHLKRQKPTRAHVGAKTKPAVHPSGGFDFYYTTIWT